MCAQKLTIEVSLSYRTEPKTETWKNEKLKRNKNGCAQKYTGKQSGESVESVRKKKKTTAERICGKGRF